MIRDPSTCIVRSPSVMWGEEGKERALDGVRERNET